MITDYCLIERKEQQFIETESPNEHIICSSCSYRKKNKKDIIKNESDNS